MSMFRVLFVVLALLVCAFAGLEAQTQHPCDVAGPSDPTIMSGSPHKLQFCSPQSDHIEAVVAYVDGVAFDLMAVTAVSGPSASGWVLYDTPHFLQVQRGTHNIEAATYNRRELDSTLQLGPRSSPFAFAAAEPTPLTVAPSIRGVVR
jgi:hypothetical protein